MDNSSIKENIRRKRKEKGMTQEEISHILNMSLTAYRDLEKGNTAMINTNIAKIADATGSSVEELVLGYTAAPSAEALEERYIEYSNRFEALTTRINDLEKLVASLEEIISSKNEIIAMLKKNID